MSINTFGHLFRVTTWGESHGEAIGATIDGCPPGIEITQNYIQHFMEKRRPGQSKYTTQRREMDLVEILSGVFENNQQYWYSLSGNNTSGNGTRSHKWQHNLDTKYHRHVSLQLSIS